MKLKARHTFFILSLLFLVYSFSIYLKPLSVYPDKDVYNKTEAGKGRMVWQKYNCQSCHQLYGLGGYLGPDLTNMISQPGKGETFLKAMIRTGNKQMPAFNLSDNEMSALVEFFKSTNASGNADPRTFNKNIFGMIEGNESE